MGLPCCRPQRARPDPDATQAASFVRQAGAELAGVVSGATSPEDKQARLGAYLQRVVDEDGVARFCLGRFWQAASPAQRAEYLRLFRMVLLRGVVTRLGDYQAGSVKVSVNTPVQKPDGMYVPTIVEREGNKPVNITWLVTEDGGAMRIADVVAEGMSLRMTQRSDYASFMARNGGNLDLLDRGLAQAGRRVGGRYWRDDCNASIAARTSSPSGRRSSSTMVKWSPPGAGTSEPGRWAADRSAWRSRLSATKGGNSAVP